MPCLKRILPLVTILSLIGCPSPDEEGEVTPIDPALAANPELIYLSAPDGEQQIAIVGLPKALAPSSRFRVLLEGTETVITTGTAGSDGAFAVLLTAPDGRPVIEGVSSDGMIFGPKQPLNPPSGTPIRPPNPQLFGVHVSPTGLQVQGLIHSARGESRIIVGNLSTADTIETSVDQAGAFQATIKGGDGETLVAFSIPPGSNADASWPVTTNTAAGFPTLITSAKSTVIKTKTAGLSIKRLSERLTCKTSLACSAGLRFLWMTPIPPSRAMAIAIRPSVTESIAAEIKGRLSCTREVSWVRRSTSRGSTSL